MSEIINDDFYICPYYQIIGTDVPQICEEHVCGLNCSTYLDFVANPFPEEEFEKLSEEEIKDNQQIEKELERLRRDPFSGVRV